MGPIKNNSTTIHGSVHLGRDVLGDADRQRGWLHSRRFLDLI